MIEIQVSFGQENLPEVNMCMVAIIFGEIEIRW